MLSVGAYAGIGSRRAPEPILERMTKIGAFLADCGFTLRSGGADGADSAFEAGCDERWGSKEIFLPWKGFNDNPSKYFKIPKEAFEIAAQFHPAWDKLSFAIRKLMARNCQQVLGENLDDPSKFVVCWNEGGFVSGGTSQALRLARDREIPIFNLTEDDAADKLWQYLQTCPEVQAIIQGVKRGT